MNVVSVIPYIVKYENCDNCLIADPVLDVPLDPSYGYAGHKIKCFGIVNVQITCLDIYHK